MKYKLLSMALAAAFALTALSQTSMASPRGSGDGGRTGGDWIINGTALSGLESSGASSLTVSGIILPDAK